MNLIVKFSYQTTVSGDIMRIVEMLCKKKSTKTELWEYYNKN